MAFPRAAGARRAGRVRLPRAAHAGARVHASVRPLGRRGDRRRREADVHVRRSRRPLGQPAPRRDGVGGARVHRERAVEQGAGDPLVLHRADVPARAGAARPPAPVPSDRRRGVRHQRAVAGRRDDRDAGDDAGALRPGRRRHRGQRQLAGRARGARGLPRHAGRLLLGTPRPAGRRFAAAPRDQPAAHPRFEEPRRDRGRRGRAQADRRTERDARARASNACARCSARWA